MNSITSIPHTIFWTFSTTSVKTIPHDAVNKKCACLNEMSGVPGGIQGTQN